MKMNQVLHSLKTTILTMKAINTRHNGNYYRSRLEARWAVYFETLKIKFDYEFEGFTTTNHNYLPDFYFPKFGFHGEVKRECFGDEDVERWTEFARESKCPLVVFEGTPHANPCRAFGMHIDMPLLVIPFAHLFVKKMGVYYHAGGHESFNKYPPFREAIRMAREKRFEFNQI